MEGRFFFEYTFSNFVKFPSADLADSTKLKTVKAVYHTVEVHNFDLQEKTASTLK